MTDRAIGCLDGSHHHRMLIDHREVDRDDQPGADGVLTLWFCPVLHTLGALWQDFDNDAEGRRRANTPEGPLEGGPLA